MLEHARGSEPPRDDDLYNEMMEQREQLKALIQQSSKDKGKGGRFFKYSTEKAPKMEVTFKDFLQLEPDMIKNAVIVTGTSVDVDVKKPDWVECRYNEDKETLSCGIENASGRLEEIGDVLAVSNFKNASSIPMERSIKIVPKTASMRCAAEKGKVLFCIGY